MRDSSSRTLRKHGGIDEFVSRSAIPSRSVGASAVPSFPLSVAASRTKLQSAARLALVFVLLLLITSHAFGDQGWEGHSLYAIWENDAIRASDRHYTQGSKLGYLSSDRATPKWLNRWSNYIPALGLEPEASKFGVE